MILDKRFSFTGVFVLSLTLPGCSTLTSWVMGSEDTTVAQDPSRAPASIENGIDDDDTRSVDKDVQQSVAAIESVPQANGISDNEFSAVTRRSDDRARRGYRRSASPWEGVEIESEGSLWNPENQANFYFTRNMIFNLGDIVTLEFEPDDSEILNKRLTSLYRPLLKPTVKDVVAEEAGKAAGEKIATEVAGAVKNENIAKAIGDDVKDRAVAAINPKKRYFTSKDITLRVVEVNNRGVVKVEGVKKLFLKQANFDLKVSGMLREQDIGSERRVASSRLLDAKMEIAK